MSFDEQQKKSVLEQILSERLNKTAERFDSEELIRSLLESLTDREQKIIARRFGLFGSEETTLETLGGEYDVTRERIRQIERQALIRLRAAAEKENRLQTVQEIVLAILEEHGGLMRDDHLIKTVFDSYHRAPSSAAEQNIDSINRAIKFVLGVLLQDHVAPAEESEHLLAGWKHPVTDSSKHETAVKRLIDYFQEHKEVIPFEEFVSDHAKRALPDLTQEQTAAHRLMTLIRLAKQLDQNVFGEVGLVSWPNIRPRRMGDKCYLVLRRQTAPLHFKTIAEKINEYRFDHKQAHAETIHNELITDERFILVGRGLYALKEWGYTPGVVSDVIESFLKEICEPQAKDQIIAAVLKQRLVKPETVYLALTNKRRFERLEDGRYRIRAENAVPAA